MCYLLFSSRFAPSSQFQSSIATGIRIACKQKPKLTWVLHHAEAYFLVWWLCFIACSPRLVSDFDPRLDSDQWLCVPWDFDPRRDLAQPGPAQPRPGAPLPLPHACPPCLSLSLIQFSRAQLPLSPTSLSSPLCPRCSGDRYRRIWIHEVSSPPLPSSSLSLSLSLSLFLFLPFPSLRPPLLLPCVRAPLAAPPAPSARLPQPPMVRPLSPPSRAAASAPRPLAARPLSPPSRVDPQPPARLPQPPTARPTPAPLRATPRPPAHDPSALCARPPRPPARPAWPRAPRHVQHIPARVAPRARWSIFGFN
jgi:hypothetical protein